jgi:UDP:flavonoid glycosyltransferase YjiC (YdhE family)
VVSLGSEHQRLELPEHMEGAEYLPQTAILPQAAVAITHGANPRSPSACTSAAR